MSKSVQIRVDRDFAKTVIGIKHEMSKSINKPITVVQVTKILNKKINEENLASNIVFIKKRGKRVLL